MSLYLGCLMLQFWSEAKLLQGKQKQHLKKKGGFETCIFKIPKFCSSQHYTELFLKRICSAPLVVYNVLVSTKLLPSKILVSLMNHPI